MTEWKQIRGFEGLYEVSNTGLIKSLHGSSTRILKQRISNGYPRVALQQGRNRTDPFVHRIVAEHFIENPACLPQINHIDGNKLNNDAANLEWVTARDNSLHARRLGLMPKIFGERHGSTPLSNQDVLDIRKRYADGERQQALGKEYGINQTCISAIVRRKTWTHI